MARPGMRIENTMTGERIELLLAGPETGGEIALIELFIKPRGFLATEHIHPNQEERVEVISGSMRFRCRGLDCIVRAGQCAVIPPRVPHSWSDNGSELLHALLAFRPALQVGSFFEGFFKRTWDGKHDEDGFPNPLRVAAWAQAYQNHESLKPQSQATGCIAPTPIPLPVLVNTGK